MNIFTKNTIAEYDFERMEKLCSELGDIEGVLEMLHNDPDTVEAGKIYFVPHVL